MCTGKGGYEWQEGARVVGESIVQGTEPKINVEHALHVLEIIEAARKSQQSGMRIKLKSKFPWPVVK
jgi:predicted dehydrogenase